MTGPGGPPRPMATTIGPIPFPAASRATCPAIAVFATRFPVPITPTVGTASGASTTGGSNRKSGPTYGIPSARATAISSIRRS